MKELNLNKM